MQAFVKRVVNVFCSKNFENVFANLQILTNELIIIGISLVKFRVGRISAVFINTTLIKSSTLKWVQNLLRFFTFHMPSSTGHTTSRYQSFLFFIGHATITILPPYLQLSKYITDFTLYRLFSVWSCVFFVFMVPCSLCHF